MNLLLAIFYSNYQDRADSSLENMNKIRNRYLLRLFRSYDKNNIGEIERDDVYEYLKEINSLYEKKDEK